MGAFLFSSLFHFLFCVVFSSAEVVVSESDSVDLSFIPPRFLAEFESKMQSITEEVVRKHSPRYDKNRPTRRQRRDVVDLKDVPMHGFVPNLYHQRDRIQIDAFTVLGAFKPCASHYGQWDTAYFNNEDYAILLCPESVQCYRYEFFGLVPVNSLPFQTSTEQVIALRNFKIRDEVTDAIRMMSIVLLYVPNQGASIRMYEIVPSVGLVEFQNLQLTGNFIQMETFIQDGSTYVALLRKGIEKSDLVVYGLAMDKGEHIDFTLMAIRTIPEGRILKAYPILANIGLLVDNPSTQTAHLYLFSHQSVEPFQIFNNLTNVVDAEFFQIGSRYFLIIITAEKWRVLMFNANEDFFHEFQTTYDAGLVGLRILDLNSFRDEKAIVLQSLNDMGQSIFSTYFLHDLQFVAAGNQSCTSGLINLGKLPVSYQVKSESLTCLSGGDLFPILSNGEARLIDNHPMLILPYTNGQTILIHFEASLVPVSSPVLVQKEEIVKRVAEYKAVLTDFSRRIRNIENLFTNTVTMDLKNNITGNWTVRFLTTLSIEVENLKYANLFLQNQEWGSTLPLSLKNVDESVSELQGLIGMLAEKLEGAIFNKTTEPVYFPNLSVNGVFRARTLEVTELNPEKMNGANFSDILHDIVRTDLYRQITGLKTIVGSLTSTAFNSETVNGLHPQAVLVQNESLLIQGPLNFTKSVIIGGNFSVPNGKVGGLDLSEEVLTPQSPIGAVIVDGTVTAEHAIVDKVDEVVFDLANFEEVLLDGSVNTLFQGPLILSFLEIQDEITVVGNVSGRDLEDFAADLLRVDRNDTYPGILNINGQVIVSNNVDLASLQGHKFPDAFAKSSGDTVFQGTYTFTNNVTADNVQVDGLVDGRDPSKLITLTSDQHIDAETVFNDGFRTNNMNIKNNLNDMHFESLIDYGIDPYLVAIGRPATKIVFGGRNVTVAGQLQADTVNSKDLEGTLMDIIYDDETDVFVTGHKEIPALYIMNAIVAEGFNGMNLEEELLTNDSDQNITGVYTFVEPVVMDSLLTPMANSISMDTLLEHAAKLNQDNTFRLESLSFENIVAKKLIVRDTINDANASTVLVQGRNQEFLAPQIFTNASFVYLQAGNIILSEGSLVSGLDLSVYDKERFSLTRNQIIPAEIAVFGNVTVGRVLTADKINNHPWEEWQSTFVHRRTGQDQIINTPIEVLNCTFVKDIIVATPLNNISVISELAQVAIDTRSPTINLDEAHFQMVISKRIEVSGLVNDVDLVELNADAVFRDTSDIGRITGKKTFVNITVMNNLQASAVNGKNFDEDVLLSDGDQVVNSHIIIAGTFTANSEVDFYYVNDIPREELYTAPAATLQVVQGNVTLIQDVHVQNLHVDTINDQSLDDFFANVALKGASNTFTQSVTLENMVAFERDLTLSWLDGEDFSRKINDLVLKDQDATISGPVAFASELILDKANLGTVQARVVSPNFVNVFENAVYIDRTEQVIRGNHTMLDVAFKENCNVRGVVNGVSIPGGLILLSHEQQFTGLKTIPGFTVLEAINFKPSASVNGYHLSKEAENTLLVSGDFILKGPKVLQGDVQTVNASVYSVNDFVWDDEVIHIKDMQETVTIHGSPTFTSPVHVVKNVQITGHTNGVNLAEINSLVLYNDMPIDSTGIWILPSARINGSVFHLEPYSYLNGHLVSDLLRTDMLDNLALQISTSFDIADQANETLAEWEGLLADAYFKVTAFDLAQSIDLRFQISAVAEVQIDSNRYLLVGTSTCSSLVYVWDASLRRFVYHSIVSNTGSVGQWVVAEGRAVLAVATRTPECNLFGIRSFVINNGTASIKNLGMDFVEAGLFAAGSQVHLIMGNAEKFVTYLVNEGGLTVQSTVDRSVEMIARSDGPVPYMATWFEGILSIWGLNRAAIITLPVQELQWMRWVRVVDAFYLLVSETPEPVKGGCLGIKVYRVLPAFARLSQILPHCSPTAVTSLEFGNFPDSMLLIGDAEGTHVYYYEGVLGFTKETTLPLVKPRSLYASFFKQQLRVFAAASDKVYVINGRTLGSYFNEKLPQA